MLLGIAVDHRIEEQRPGSKIDNRRASDAERVDVAARQPGCDRRTEVALPNDVAVVSVERIDIVRFRHRNDHGPVGTTLDIKWLSVNVARYFSVEGQVAR